ncbi:MAG: sulfatase family protein [Solirubrobacterales bacterium]
MIRRAAIALAGLVLALGLAPAAKAAKQEEVERPNIVMVVTDDQTLGMLNQGTMPETLARLGGEGTTFTNAVATTPLCCPSRASMLTGQYGHNNGVLDNKYRLLNEKRNVLPVWLRQDGYTTIHVGRYLNGYERVARARTRPAPGWDQWHSLIKPRRYYGYTLSVNGGTRPYTNAPADYLTSVLTERSVQMINRFGPQKKPFYLQLDHLAPHTSGGEENGGRCLGSAIPGPLDEDAFDNEPLPTPANFDEENVEDKPSFIRNLPRIDEERIDNLERRYQCALGSLREVDRSIAAIDEALRAVGEKKKTVFIFLSDNGYYYGEHRIPNSKNYPYAEAYQLPLLIRAPRKYLNAPAPSVVSEPVANIDLAPTILGFAQADSCKKPEQHRCRTMDGRSLVPLLSGEEGRFPTDRGLVIELSREGGVSVEDDGSGTCTYQGLYAPGSLYVEHTAALDPATGVCVPVDEKELYDLTADPFQLNSSAVQTASLLPPSALQAGLAARLATLRNCAGISGRDRHQEGRPFCE